MLKRFATMLVCDDVRKEARGLKSYIGVYPGFIVLNEFPKDLPKLHIVLDLYNKQGEPLESIKAKIKSNCLPDKEIVFDVDVSKKPSQEFQRKYIKHQIDVNIEPCPILKEGHITGYIIVNGRSFYAGTALFIKNKDKNPQDTTSS